MNLTGQIDTWRIHLVLEGIFICVKLMQLILLSPALDLTLVKFLLLEPYFLGDLEQAETIGNEGRVEGESILFCYAPYSMSKIGWQEHKAHIQYPTAPETSSFWKLLLWWLLLWTMKTMIDPVHLIFLFFLIIVKNRQGLMSFPWWKWHVTNWCCKLPNGVWDPGTEKRMRMRILV